MTYKKYIFNNKEQATKKVAALYDNGNPIYNMSIAMVGQMIDKAAVYEGEELITDATYKDGYAVDVIFSDLTESPYGFKAYEVKPKEIKHTFLGW